MKITFAKLRDDEGWGLRGSKEPGTSAPAEGSTVKVTKRDETVVSRSMGRIVAQGDDWWLATCGFKKDTRPPGRREADGWGMDRVEQAGVEALTALDEAEDEARLADRNETLDRDEAIKDTMESTVEEASPSEPEGDFADWFAEEER